MTVGVGSESDIEGFVGFTHLIEHLLFTGSKNFPEQHHIEKIVNKHQGEQNGVTKAFSTTFYFKIDKDGLEDFIPALVDAVKNPTFSEENILKEINNVNSEISMRMTYNKNLAYYKLLKTVGNQKSKLFQDGFSNIDASKINVSELREKLIAFHANHYSANLMTMAVISDDDFRGTRRMIESQFGSLPNLQLQRAFFNTTVDYVEPLGKDVFRRIYYLQGFTEPSKLTLVFQCRSDMKNQKFHPLDFFSLFLNYFSQNSLKQNLIKKNLITSFSDTIALQDYVNSIYIVSFTLTADGLNRITEILKEFFQFVEFVKKIPNKQEIFNDLSKASKYSFLFGVKSEFMDFSQSEQGYFDRAADFSELIQDYSPDMIFSAKNVLFKYNQTEFDASISGLKPQQAFYIIESSKYTRKEISEKLPLDMPVKNRRLKLIKKQHKKRNSKADNNHLKSFFGFSESTLLGHIGFHERVLAEELLLLPKNEQFKDLDKENKKDLLPFEHHFNAANENIVLEETFNFDNGRMYTTKTIPSEDFAFLEVNPNNQSDLNYDTCQSFDTTHLNMYNMITKCKPPTALTTMVQTEQEKTEDVIAFVNNFKPEDVHQNGIRTEKLFDAIFNDRDQPMETNQRYVILRDLLVYKLCIIKDFDNDDKHENAKTVSESNELNVYHQLFRKTLQPKSVIIMTLESKNVLTAIKKNNFNSRIEKALLMEVLCMYVMRHVEFLHREEYIKGNDFSCKVINYRVVLQFEGFTQLLEPFIFKALSAFEDLTHQEAYQQYIIQNFQQRIIDVYSQFTSISSLKLSTFYLNLVMDKIFIDNSSPEKVAHIIELVKKINSENLSVVMSDIVSTNKLYVLGVGNVEEPFVNSLSSKARSVIPSIKQENEETIDFLEFRKYIFSNFSTKIKKDEHLMVRLENIDKSESNSVYLTYFKIKKMTRLVKIHALILNHFLKKLVYDHLRNNLNLGYVTQSGLKVYYHNVGLIILVQGEKFRPNKLEGVVDDMLQLFLSSVTKINKNELNVVKQSVLSDLVEFSSSLKDVSGKYYENIEDQLLNKNEAGYEEIMKKVDQISLRDFAEQFLIRNSRRLTIELFANHISPAEKSYKLMSNFSLNQKEYRITTLEEIAQFNDI